MATRASHARGRGAPLLGLASLLCLPAFADGSFADRVFETYGTRSYVLIEEVGKAPRLILLYNPGDPRPQPAGTHVSAIDRIVLDLADPDVEVRVDAVLSLAEFDRDKVDHLLLAATLDASAEVRSTAEAVLEDMRENSKD